MHYQDDGSASMSGKDEFHHRYEYDANNRITAAYTSRDGRIWDRDATYLYYDHGPLARTEIGDRHVMGTDYAYTIHGWIKGVNSDTRDEDRDIGSDGSSNSAGLNYSFARDAAGYSLHYYDGDYAAVNASPGSNYFLAGNTGSDYYTNLNSLFNGNIAQMTTAITDASETQMDVQGRNFRYDQLNRIRQVNAYKESGLVSSNQWTSSDMDNGDYYEAFTYDLNGNIITAGRNGDLSGTSQQMDALHYYYYTTSGGSYDPASGTPSDATNKLNYVSESATSADGDYGNDINSGQSASNYTYDATGNLITDASEEILNIEWTVTGKIKSVTRIPTSDKPDLEFVYDAMGNRIIKIVKPRRLSNSTKQEEWTYTYYVRDAMGNILATYTRTFENDGDDFIDNFTVSEWDMYGSSRIGVRKPIGDESLYSRGFSATYSGLDFDNVTYGIAPASFYCTDGCLLTRTLGKKEFEFTNHLGNVLETVSDIRLPVGTASSHTVDYYTSDVLSYADYYVFGSTQSNRAGGDYRFSFNGKEKTNEIAEGDLDFGARMYSASLGRFLSGDKYGFHSANEGLYNFAGNHPVHYIDKDGNYQYPAKYAAAYAKQYPILTNYLQNYIHDDIMGSPNIIQAFKDHSKDYPTSPLTLTDNKISEMATWGKGPKIEFMLNPGGLEGAFGHYRSGDQTLEISTRVADWVEGILEDPNSNADEKQGALLCFYSLIVHESAHHVDYLDGFSSQEEEVGYGVTTQVWVQELLWIGNDAIEIDKEQSMKAAIMVIEEKKKSEEGWKDLPSIPGAADSPKPAAK